MDSYCDSKFHGKVGDKDGFANDTVLTTDKDGNLKLVKCEETDVHSGFSCLDQDLCITVKKNKQTTTHGPFKQGGFVRQVGFHRYFNL